MFFSTSLRAVLALYWIAVPSDAQDKVTNIDYLGLGYDVIHGNPHNDLYDPGFRDSVFQLDYSLRSVSSDGYWLIPDNVQVLQTFSCSYETESQEIHGTTSYTNSLAVDAAIEGT